VGNHVPFPDPPLLLTPAGLFVCSHNPTRPPHPAGSPTPYKVRSHPRADAGLWPRVHGSMLWPSEGDERLGVLPGRTGRFGCALDRILPNHRLKSRCGGSRVSARLLEQTTMTVMGMAGAQQHLRLGGWWGIVFSAGLLIEASMVSVPTAALSGEEIQAFYA